MSNNIMEMIDFLFFVIVYRIWIIYRRLVS